MEGIAMKKNDRDNYLCKQELIEDRKWTEASINKFLGEPDKEKNKWDYPETKVKLYDIKRIKKVEVTDEFIEWMEKSIKRRKKTRETIERKRLQKEEEEKRLRLEIEEQKLKEQKRRRKEFPEWIKNYSPDIPDIDYNDLLEKAIDNYNELKHREYLDELDDYKELESHLYEGEKLTQKEVEEINNELMQMDEPIYRKTTKDDNKELLNRICVNYIRHELTSYDSDIKNHIPVDERFWAVDEIRNKINQKIYEKYPYLKNDDNEN